MRSWPMPSTAVGCWVCGSHFAHSHCSLARPVLTTATSRSSGEWKVTSWPSMALARPRVSSRSPCREIAANPRIVIMVGRPGTIEWARTKRRSASVAIGSSSSTGPVCGGTRRVASRCEPRAMRTWPKSGSACLRSHMRRLVASDHSDCGSGWFHSSEARWSSAASLARSRICPRYRR